MLALTVVLLRRAAARAGAHRTLGRRITTRTLPRLRRDAEDIDDVAQGLPRRLHRRCRRAGVFAGRLGLAPVADRERAAARRGSASCRRRRSA